MLARPSVLALLSCAVGCTGSPTTAADLVIRDADVWTVDADDTRATALAITDGAFVWVEDARRPVRAGSIGGGPEVEAPAEEPATAGVLGGTGADGVGVAPQAAVPGQHAVARGGVERLEQVVPDRPVAIMEQTSHAVWVNTSALAALGYDATTPDPVGGVILRDDAGTPTGLLLDAAGERAFDLALEERPSDLNEAALRLGLAEAARHGITSLGDGRAYWKRGYVDAWQALAAAGELTLRAQVPLWAYPDADDTTQIATLTSLRDGDGSDRLRVGQIKLYSDGIVWLTTGAMLEPYVTSGFAGPTGLTYFDGPRLTRYVTELEAAGFDMHIHAIGDRGVRQALDAIEAARDTNGAIGARHRLTHVEYVAPEDVPRFSALNVAADLQLSGAWTQPAALHDNDFLVGAARVDERAFRLRDLHDSGARVVLSSDFDVGPMSPFTGLARSIDRGDQSLPDLSAALRAVTLDAAWVLRQDDITGSIEVGKRADLVVVDRALETATRQELASTEVLWTVVDGEAVWRAPAFSP